MAQLLQEFIVVQLVNTEQCQVAVNHTLNQLTWVESLPVSAINWQFTGVCVKLCVLLPAGGSRWLKTGCYFYFYFQHFGLAVCFDGYVRFVCNFSFMCVCQLTFVSDVSIAEDDERVSRAFHYVSQNLLTKAEQQVSLSLGTAFLPLSKQIILLGMLYYCDYSDCINPSHHYHHHHQLSIDSWSLSYTRMSSARAQSQQVLADCSTPVNWCCTVAQSWPLSSWEWIFSYSENVMHQSSPLCFQPVWLTSGSAEQTNSSRADMLDENK